MKNRYFVLDALRGFALVNMILYHALWDVVNIFHADVPWFTSDGAHIWQQLICHTFILLSGFCWHFGKKKLKNGIIVLGASVIITAVTAVFMKNSIILFGVLCLLGSSMLLMIPLDKALKKINPFLGFAVFLLMFLLTKNISDGFIGIGETVLFEIPEDFYKNYLTAYLGFPFRGFYSADYFPIIPWLFLFVCGYYLNPVFSRLKLMKHLSSFRCRPLEFLGRHSLIFYMIHQPVVYGILLVIL
ncbi:MAG: DUF1624 domain-containing protein [Clostridia bacterium]|nr:DUF1624 domain-containing protein [Clostridia bacterium]